MNLEELEHKFGQRWVICPKLAVGVAAYRKVELPSTSLDGDEVNVTVARDLDELAGQLAGQEAY
jgi:hypothetical protein